MRNIYPDVIVEACPVRKCEETVIFENLFSGIAFQMLTLPCDNNMEIRNKLLQKFWEEKV